MAAPSAVLAPRVRPQRWSKSQLFGNRSESASTATARRMTAAGADARAIDVGAVGHDLSVLEAAPKILEWLEALSAPP